MRGTSRPSLSSRGLKVAVLFGLFVLFDIALFGMLILDSLSERELDKIFFETRQEAEPFARELTEKAEQLDQDDLYVVVSASEETRRILGGNLLGRKIVRSYRILDHAGNLVLEDRQVVQPAEAELNPPLALETEVPIGELGSLVVGVSEAELERRVGLLRQDLVRQASLVGAVSVAFLGAAFATIVVLFRRADRLESQAAEAERMAMIGTLASGLAHEIRNPLNSLNLNMQMLEEEARERTGGPSEKRILALTRSEISRLESLVTDFLSYAKPRPLELEEIAAEELFESVLEVLAGEIRAHGATVVVHDENAQRLRVDRDQMSQLLINLVQNAFAATATAGRTPRIELRARRHAGRPALEISDNGCGIPAAEQAKIFDLFYSTKKGGTGLGLAIVERIARSHDADLEVDSTPGEGATIRVLLAAVD